MAITEVVVNYMEIYNSNCSNEFVKGAERAWRYIKRVGVQNITA